MKVIDMRRNLPAPGTIIDLEPGDIVRFPDGHSFRLLRDIHGSDSLEVISAEEAQDASDRCCDSA